MFFGRTEELKSLKKLRQKDSASLVCILGRRRIGKSTLVEHFGADFKSFIRFQGLGPSSGSSVQTQLDHFANQLSLNFDTRKEHFEDWTDALTSLAQKTAKGECLIFLDEISWMGQGDPLFSAKIKDVWDRLLKKNPQTILVLCGSVSSWIEENILKNANFVGRISLEINLQELLLNEVDAFLKHKKMFLGSLEKMLLLSITGGVPKYLEELIASDSVEQNILRMCFRADGVLLNEYDKIFSEIFGRKNKTYEKIIRKCLDKRYTPVQLAHALGKEQNNDFSENIHALILSGFLSRDYCYSHEGKQSKLSQLRVKDNYLRFYLKHLLPLKDKIQSKAVKINSLFDLRNFESTLGLQFENVLLSNREKLYELLEIQPVHLLSSSPYFQSKTTKNRGACQIDLLIHTHLDVFYLCEFKCKKRIDLSVIKEVEKKMKALSLPRRSALKPILVYEGDVSPSHQEKLGEFFFKVIPFGRFF